MAVSALNKAIKKTQQVAQKKMMSLSGGLSGLMGGGS